MGNVFTNLFKGLFGKKVYIFYLNNLYFLIQRKCVFWWLDLTLLVKRQFCTSLNLEKLLLLFRL